jgi:hypothetical protein
MKTLTLVALLAIAAGASAAVRLQDQARQDGKPKRFTHPVSKDADGGMARWMATMQPGPAHERLSEMLGSYEVTMRMSMGPGMPAMEEKGTAEITWFTEGK